MVMLLSAADPLIRLVSRNNIELPGLLLAALMIQVVAHGLRRAYELTCFALNHSWLFFKASIAGTLAPALMVVLLDRMQSLFALPIAFVVAEGAFIAGLHVGLAARGYGFSGIARASAALGVAILSAAGLTAALAALLESPAGLVGAAAVGTFAYVVILNATGFLTVSELQRLVAALRQSRTSTSEPQDSLLPAHLPRREIHHEPDSTTCACGCAMTRIGEEVVEQLDYSPDLFSVERHIRGKWACTTCETPLHAPIPAQVIEAGIPTARLLAQVLVSKYADHMPLYRQEQRFRLAGVPIPRATLRDWVGICEVRLLPLVNALRETMLTRAVLHADETPVAMREPGHGITQRAYLWRSYCSTQFDAIQTVVYDFVAGGSGRNAKELLSDWRGTLVCHNYSGHTALFEAGVTEAGCMAHARRKFHELRANDKGALGQDVLELFGELYEIESEAAELDPAGRRLLRESKSRPVAETLYGWLALHRQQVADGTAMAMAIDYSLSRWGALTRFLSDPGVPIDNDRIEITLRPIALGRANWMFAGSMRNGQRAATMMSLIESARLNGHDPYAYLRDVLERLPTQPSSRIDELLPHRWKPIDAA
jgi:transposase